MSERPSASKRSDGDSSRLIDVLCDEFEHLCRAGRIPSVEGYLGKVGGSLRDRLREELEPIEQHYAARAAGAPEAGAPDAGAPEAGAPEAGLAGGGATGGSGQAGMAGRDSSPGNALPTCRIRPVGWSSAGLVVPAGEGLALPDDWPLGPPPVPDSLTHGWEAGVSPELVQYSGLLRATLPFRALGPESYLAILAQMRLRQVAAGTPLLKQDHSDGPLTLLLEGAAEVIVRHDREQHRVDHVQPLALLGEMSLLAGVPCTADVITCEPSKIATLERSQARSLLARFPDLSAAMSRLMASRLGAAPIDSLLGKRMGDYQILSCVGHGSMGVVYDVRHQETNRQLALKMMSHRFAYDAHAISLFHREAEIGGLVKHPHVARCFDGFREFNTWFLALEFCPGESLRTVLDQVRVVPLERTQQLLGQLASALVYLHGQGIVHRDVKPANVMVDSSWHAKLTDFGLACRIAGGDQQPQELAGTPAYMAPELLITPRQPASAATDAYALGCVGWEMLTGDLDGMGECDSAALADLRKTHDLWAVIEGLLAPEPARRLNALKSLARA